MPTRALCLVTQVVVDGRDPAFRRPTKPVGPSYDRAEAQRIAHETGHVFRAMPDKQWRRVVPSPAPLRIVEAEPLRQIVEAGHVVVPPVVAECRSSRSATTCIGVEAVIDKDLTASRLALLVEADQLVILTEVARVQVGFGTPAARDARPRSPSPRRASCSRPVSSRKARWDRRCGPASTSSSGGGRRAVIGALTEARDVVFGRCRHGRRMASR